MSYCWKQGEIILSYLHSTLSAKCWIMKDVFDILGFSKSAFLLTKLLYSFWSQFSSVPWGNCKKDRGNFLNKTIGLLKTTRLFTINTVWIKHLWWVMTPGNKQLLSFWTSQWLLVAKDFKKGHTNPQICWIVNSLMNPESFCPERMLPAIMDNLTPENANKQNNR